MVVPVEKVAKIKNFEKYKKKNIQNLRENIEINRGTRTEKMYGKQ